MGMFDDLVSKGMFDDLVEAPVKPIEFGEAFVEKPMEKFPFSPIGAIKTADLVASSKRIRENDYETTKQIEAAKTPEGKLRKTSLQAMYSRYSPTASEISALERVELGIKNKPDTSLSPLGKKDQQRDIKVLTEYFEDMAEKEKRGYSLWGKVGAITSAMPAFMIEFLSTGGIKALGSKVAREMGEKVLKESAKKGVGKIALKTVGFAAGAGARALAMPHRGAEAILKRRLPTGMDVQNGELILTGSEENRWTSLWKGMADHYIEIASEEAGEVIAPYASHLFKKLPFVGKLVGALQKKWLSKFPQKTPEMFNKLLKKGGFHGLLVEMNEEDIAWVTRAILNIEDFGAGKDTTIGERLLAGWEQDRENMLAEAISFSIPGIMRGMLAKAPPTKEEMPTPLVPQFVETAEGIIGFEPEEFDVPEVSQLANQSGLGFDESIDLLDDIRNPYTVALEDKRNKDGVVKATTTTLKQFSKKKKPKTTVGELKESIAGTILTPFSMRHWRINRLLRHLDGGEDGVLTNLIWKPVKKSAIASHLRRQDQSQQLIDLFTKSDLDIAHLLNKRERINDNVILTPEQKIEIYMATKDKGKMHHLKIGGFRSYFESPVIPKMFRKEAQKLSDKDIKDVLEKLTDQEKQLGNTLIGIYKDQRPEIAYVYQQLTGKELGDIEGYSPIRVEGDYISLQDYVQETLTREYKVKKRGVRRAFTKERVNARNPVRLGAITNFINHTQAVAHFNESALIGKDVSKLLHNPNVQYELNKATNQQGSKILNKWLEDTLSESPMREITYFGKMLMSMRINAVASMLGLNVLTIMKQPVSTFMAAAESPKMIGHLFTNFALLVRPGGRKELINYVNSQSNLVKTRNMERELREMFLKKRAALKLRGKKTLSETALSGIRYMDRTTVALVWKSAYDMAKADGMLETNAKEYADSVVSRTQPMAGVEDLPTFFRGGPLEKLFSTFMNQINQNINYWKFDIFEEAKTAKISSAEVSYKVMMSLIIPALLIGMISRGKPPDLKKAGIDLAAYAVVPIFFFGQILSSIMQGFSPEGTVATQWTSDLNKALTVKKPAAKVKYGIRAVAELTGIPVVQPLRTFNGIIDMYRGDTTDPKRLIWSAYYLKETPVGEPLKLPKRRKTLRRRKRTR